MKIIACLGLFLLTAFLFVASFYLITSDTLGWGYFLGAGIFSLLISASLAGGNAEKEEIEDD